jgi:S-(hydroxymethyl)glutathione dehydrogenase/alcohol dehydrogenase
MKARAAVAFAANKPLDIVELDLEGPKPGEVWSTSWRRGSAITRSGSDRSSPANVREYPMLNEKR